MSFLTPFLRRPGLVGYDARGENMGEIKTPVNLTNLNSKLPFKSILRNANHLSASEKIQVALKLLRGQTLAAMCAAFGRTPQHVSVVIGGKRESEILRRQIASYLGLEVDDIFPA